MIISYYGTSHNIFVVMVNLLHTCIQICTMRGVLLYLVHYLQLAIKMNTTCIFQIHTHQNNEENLPECQPEVILPML